MGDVISLPLASEFASLFLFGVMERDYGLREVGCLKPSLAPEAGRGVARGSARYEARPSRPERPLPVSLQNNNHLSSGLADTRRDSREQTNEYTNKDTNESIQIAKRPT